MDEVVDALKDIVSELQELNHKLDQVSDGLFYLNLHVGAEVTPWTGRERTSIAPPTRAATPLLSQGVVKWYDTGKGYGFITQTGGGPDVFVYHTAVPPPGYLHEGQRVAFEVLAAQNGPMAHDLRFV